jgi:hypothetical protein
VALALLALVIGATTGKKEKLNLRRGRDGCCWVVVGGSSEAIENAGGSTGGADAGLGGGVGGS